MTEKINNGTPFEKDGKRFINKKTLDGFMKFACEEARKQAKKGARSACIDDATVFGWAIHYFEEESIEGTLYNEDGTEFKPICQAAASRKNSVAYADYSLRNAYAFKTAAIFKCVVKYARHFRWHFYSRKSCAILKGIEA